MMYCTALRMGYVDGATAYSRGYRPRNDCISTLPVKRAGKRGPRAGQLYVELPCYNSTQYHIRQYLVWAGEGPEPEWEDSGK